MRAFGPLTGVMLLALCAPVAAQAPLTAAQEQALKAGDGFRECAGCPEMVVVPAGAFLMGSPENEADRDANEGPQRRVTITRPFALGRFELTVDQFAAFVAETGYDAGTVCDLWQDGSFAERPGYSFRKTNFPQTGAHPATMPVMGRRQGLPRRGCRARPAARTGCRARPNGNMRRAPARPAASTSATTRRTTAAMATASTRPRSPTCPAPGRKAGTRCPAATAMRSRRRSGASRRTRSD